MSGIELLEELLQAPARPLRRPDDGPRHHRQRRGRHAEGRLRLPDQAPRERRAAAGACAGPPSAAACSRENRLLQEQLRDRFRIENIVGAHGSMQDVFRVVHKVAASTSTVLIYGESGTGKELVARALHQESDRRDRPFYAVNVGRAPREHPRGRAVRPREGGLHRRRGAQDRPLRAGLGLDAVPRRGGRPEARPAGQAAARAAGAGDPARRRHRADPRGRADRGRHEPGPGAGGTRGALPRGPLLPAERHPDRAAAAARAAHRHPAARRALPEEVRRGRHGRARSARRPSRC